MPLNKKGKKVEKAMEKEYGKEKGKKVFHAAEKKGAVKDVVKKKSKGK